MLTTLPVGRKNAAGDWAATYAQGACLASQALQSAAREVQQTAATAALAAAAAARGTARTHEPRYRPLGVLSISINHNRGCCSSRVQKARGLPGAPVPARAVRGLAAWEACPGRVPLQIAGAKRRQHGAATVAG